MGISNRSHHVSAVMALDYIICVVFNIGLLDLFDGNSHFCIVYNMESIAGQIDIVKFRLSAALRFFFCRTAMLLDTHTPHHTSKNIS